MALWGRQNRAITFPPPQDLIPRRTARPNRLVTQDTAFHLSVIWACLRLRASLASTFPVDIFRRITDPTTAVSYQIECPKPPVFKFPGGPRISWIQWMYATEMDLGRTGNAFGIISQVDGLKFPARIDLIPATDVSVLMTSGSPSGYRYKGVVYTPEQIWHERRNIIPGLEIGLSPVAYASWSIGAYASLDQFIVEFLDNGTMPSVVMKNTTRQLNPVQAKEYKDQYRATLANGDALVLGADWEFSAMKADMTGLNWLAAQQYKAEEICRFFNVPHDLVDVATSGSGGAAKITYANINQRNLQFLIYNLAPDLVMREEHISNMLLPDPRYMKFNTDSLLRLDALSRHQIYQLKAMLQMATPTEFRELENLPPLTPQQKQELADMKALAAPAVATPNAMLNPDQKGLAQSRARRDYFPIDSVGSGMGPMMADQDHCQACHDGVGQMVRAVETIFPNGYVSQVDNAKNGGMPEGWHGIGAMAAPAPCDCPAGCPCNPVGMGCIFPPGACACGCGQDEDAAQPTYTPPGSTPQFQGDGGMLPDGSHRSACGHELSPIHIHLPELRNEIHLPENRTEVHLPEITVHSPDVHFSTGDTHIGVPETTIRIMDDGDD